MVLLHVSEAVKSSAKKQTTSMCSLLGEAQAPSYTGSDVPDQDVNDNENAAPPLPTAPPADMFGSYAGYENVNFGN